MRLVKYWSRLLREADAPSLKLFNGKLDDALSNLLQCKSVPVQGRSLDQDDLLGSFQPKPLYGSILCL